MGRKKIDVDQIGWAEQIKEDVSISGSFTVDGSTKVKSNSLVNQKAIQFDGTSAGININDSIEAFRFTLDESDSDANPNFPGTDGYTEPAPGGDLPFSISVWCYVEQTTGNTQVIVSKWIDGQGVGTKEYFFAINNSRNVMFILYDDISNTGHQMREITTTSVPLNQWFHLTATYGANSDFPNSDATPLSSLNTDIKIYLNGVQMSSSNAGSNKEYEAMSARRDDFPSLTFGNTQNASLNRPFHGELADVCVFNKELSSQEVLEVYNNNSVKNMEEFSDYNSIVGWWKMGDHIDTTGEDGIKGYVGGCHGTLGDGASIVSETTLGSDVSSTIHFNTSGSVGIGTSNPGAELDVIGNSKFLGDVDVDGKIAVRTETPATELHLNGALTIQEKTSDPDDPAEGHSVLWMSDGTGTGDDGDILIKITAGGVTKTVTLVDFSAS